MKEKLLTLMVVLFFSSQSSAELDDKERREVEHLLEFIKSSECTFNRNGSDYSAVEAYGHINRKYSYVYKRGLVDNAEDFIKYSATKSSMSGNKYTVICGGSELYSAEWLRNELVRFRRQRIELEN